MVGNDNVCDKEAAVALACHSLLRKKVGILSQELRQVQRLPAENKDAALIDLPVVLDAPCPM